MTTKKFDATPTAGEPINLEEISKESVQEAWKDYEAKPEYKAFNKHDLIGVNATFRRRAEQIFLK